nr:hypothetical protein [Klebsiella pneumoniae]
MRGKQYWRHLKTWRIIFQQKLLHAFAVVMKQCILSEDVRKSLGLDD